MELEKKMTQKTTTNTTNTTRMLMIAMLSILLTLIVSPINANAISDVELEYNQQATINLTQYLEYTDNKNNAVNIEFYDETREEGDEQQSLMISRHDNQNSYETEFVELHLERINDDYDELTINSLNNSFITDLNVSTYKSSSFEDLIDTTTFNLLIHEEPSFTFNLYNENEEILDRNDLYISTPCPENTFGWATQEHQQGKELYIQKVSEGTTKFENLIPLDNYEFCILRGDISNIDKKDFQRDYSINSINKIIEIGSFTLTTTHSYDIYINENELYSVFHPEYWGFSMQMFFFIVFTLLIGGGLTAYGMIREDRTGIIMGTITIMIGIILSFMIYLFSNLI